VQVVVRDLRYHEVRPVAALEIDLGDSFVDRPAGAAGESEQREKLAFLREALALIVEVTGDEQKVDGLVELLRPRGIAEMVRTGKVAMVRGSVVQTRPAAQAAPAA